MIKAKINDIPVEVPAGTTILDAARKIHVNIPTLCKHPDLNATAGCGICIVKVKGSNKLLRSCCTDISEGMEVTTHDSEIIQVRKTVLELILSNHPDDCLHCGRNTNCELQNLAAHFVIRGVPFHTYKNSLPKDFSTGNIVLVPNKCILCGRCVDVCQNIQNVWALNFVGRGISTRIAPAGDILLADSPCVRCGQCAAHCPTGAIVEYDNTYDVWHALHDKDKYCIVQIAPAVRVAIGEAFGYEPGELLTNKLYAVLKKLGFKTVFDTNFSADVTIIEEATEFVSRFTTGGTLPLITSCCPSWVDFMEKYQIDMIDHFSTCKSPQQMMGALTKTYFAEKEGIDPKKIFMVSIMPCTAKKYEISRTKDMSASGIQDTDAVLTTRELSRMIKQSGIDFKNLPGDDPDHIMGDYSGAGTIFAATGGVMEAAIRTAYHYVTGENLKDVNVEAVRGLKGVKEGVIDIKGTKVKVAVAHGLGNVEYVLNKVKEAKLKGEEPPYHFIEVMACPGGCVGGGGQPYGVTDYLRTERAAGIYKDDVDQEIRCSHDNPMIKKLYQEYLGEPGSKKAHHLLHTHYEPKPVYIK
ncbi:MAG: iron hydrogenase small subunit [Deltaproteobacteria bacterium]|nr:iron hydrogenase small subunit [Deltaproteobacteria bacterium]